MQMVVQEAMAEEALEVLADTLDSQVLQIQVAEVVVVDK
jgi:hypothetical protein